MRQINKKNIWLYFIISYFLVPYFLMAVTQDTNISSEYKALEALGSVFEPLFSTHATNITTIIVVFTALFGAYVTFIAISLGIKMNNIEKNISENRETIVNIRIDAMESIDKSEKWFIEKIDDINNRLEKDIETKMKSEIISSSTEMLKNVEEHAYKELSYKMENIKYKVEKRLFTYQNLIYDINMNKGLEYDEVLKEETDANTKLKNMVDIQKKYNETNNITIPNLLSPYVKKDVIPALKKLSEIDELEAIIEEFMIKMLDLNIYSVSDASMIKNILEKHYNYNYDEELKSYKR